MKKTLLLSFIAAGCLQASEYNIFVSSFKKSDYNTLNTIKSKIEKLISNSKYTDTLEVKARPSNPSSPGNSKYHTVVIETGNIDNAKAAEIRDFIRENTIYKDAYYIIKKPSNSTLKTVKPELVEAKKITTVETKNDLDDLDESTGSLLDEIANKSDDELGAPSFNTSESANSLTIDKMIAGVLESNPVVNANKNEYLKSLKDLDIASAGYYPILNLYANGGYSKKTNKVHNDPKRSGKGLAYDASLVLTQNIFNGGKDLYSKKLQSNVTNAAAYKLIQDSNEIVYESSKAYLDLIKAQMLLEIAEKNVQAHKDIYSVIKDRVSSGFARASDERQAGSRLALAENNLLSAQNDLKDANSRFARLYGKSVDTSLLVMPEFKGSIPYSLDELNSLSKKCSPSVKIQSENISAYEYQTKVSKGNYLPKLDLELSAGYNKDKVFQDYNTDSKGADMSAKLKFAYNLFNKGTDKLNVEKSKISELSSQMNYNSTLRELSESNEFAFNSYNISNDKLKYLEQYVKYSKETLMTYQDEFKLGKRDLINVLDAQSEYFSALKEQVSTKSNILLIQYKILNNLGVISESFVNGYARQYISSACSVDDIK